MTAAPQDDLPHDNNAAVNVPHPMLSATHFCRDCRALWRQCDDFTFNLRSEKACAACDNTPVGGQLMAFVDAGDAFLPKLDAAPAEPVAEIRGQRFVALEPQMLPDGTNLYASPPRSAEWVEEALRLADEYGGMMSLYMEDKQPIKKVNAARAALLAHLKGG